MKYYIEYPIPIRCDLQCAYCFHAEKWELEAQGRGDEKYSEVCAFTPQQYMAWRDRHLADGTDFICELHGGEISHPDCQAVVLDIIDTLDKECFQLQTNGLDTSGFYAELIKRKDKIDRIGFTYHRAEIGSDNAQEAVFNVNLFRLLNSGVKVYVKELFIPELRDEIISAKKLWESQGIDFRIQDFKGYRGREPIQYTSEDYALIYPEYRHNGTQCYCRNDRKQVLIRGYDIFAGDVLACWNDPCVIGNIVDDWYNPNYTINRVNKNAGIDVTTDKKIYRGTYPNDIWSPEVESKFGNLNKSQLNRRSMFMKAQALKRAEELAVQMQQISEKVDARQKQIDANNRQNIELQGEINSLTRQFDAVHGAKVMAEEFAAMPDGDGDVSTSGNEIEMPKTVV